MGHQPRQVRLRRGDRSTLEQWLRSRTTPQRLMERAQVLLSSAAGLSSYAIEEKYGYTRNKVRRWLDRYEAEGLTGIEVDRPRSGRPRTITADVEAEVVHRTLHTKPEDATHWSTRSLAKAMGWARLPCIESGVRMA